MSAKEITALMVEPGKHPKVTKLKDDLDSLQKAVSIGADYQGLIEFVSLGNNDCIMCNEEGKLIGLEGNRRLGDDILVGVFYIMSENDEGELVSLTEQKIKYYTERFWVPEAFDREDIEATVTWIPFFPLCKSRGYDDGRAEAQEKRKGFSLLKPEKFMSFPKTVDF